MKNESDATRTSRRSGLASTLTWAVLLLLPGLQARPAMSGTGEWTSGGPEGGTVDSIAYDPTTPGRVLSGVALNGVYESTDGGATWSAARDGLSLRTSFIAVHPSGWIYAAASCCSSEEVYRSTDGGTSWQDVSIAGATVSGAVAVDPGDASTAYVGDFFGGVYKTVDGGASWVLKNSGFAAGTVRAVAVDPLDSLTVYAGGSGSTNLHKSLDGGDTWNPSNAGLTGTVWDVAIDPTTPSVVFAASSGGLYRSDDGGASWTQELTGSFWRSVAIDPDDPLLVLAGGMGISRSTDGGATWLAAAVPDGTGLVEDLAVEPAPASAPAGSSSAAAGSSAGALRSVDGGVSWTLETSGMDGFLAAASASPVSHPDVVHTAGIGDFVFSSTDGGASWTSATVPGPSDLEVAPSDPDTVYGVIFSDLLQSRDAGATWSTTLTDPGPFGLFGPSIEAVGVDPLDERTVWVANSYFFFEGFPAPPQILRSTDGARTYSVQFVPDTEEWEIILNFDLEVDPTDPDRVYVTSWGRAPGSFDWVSLLTRSTDGGASWDVTSFGVGEIPWNVEVSPVDSNVAYLTLTGVQGNDSRLMKSLDGGATWNEVVTPLDCVGEVAPDPLLVDTIYASCTDVWVSRDGGSSWEPVEDSSFPENLSVWDVTVSDGSPRRLHAGSSAGLYSLLTRPRMSIGSACPSGGAATFDVTNASPTAAVRIFNGDAEGSFIMPPGRPCAGTELGISGVQHFRKLSTDGTGNGSVSLNIPSSACDQVYVALDMTTCSVSELAEP